MLHCVFFLNLFILKTSMEYYGNMARECLGKVSTNFSIYLIYKSSPKGKFNVHRCVDVYYNIML